MTFHRLLTTIKWLSMSLVLLLVTIPTVTWAALPAYMRITGETQGVVVGGVTHAGKEGSMEVIGFGHSISAPYDVVSGLPKNARQHRPIRVLKDVDRATPILANLLFNNENITEFSIKFYRTNSDGSEHQYYTVELLGAHLVSITPIHSSTIPNSTDINPEPMREALTFTYQKIIITWEDGGITAEDDWETPSPGNSSN